MRYYSLLCVVAGLLPLAVITGLSAMNKGFVLFGDYISGLGIGQYAILFNGSLVLAALLSAPFLAGMRKGTVSYMFIGAATSLVGIGLFPLPSLAHWYFAAGFFLLIFASILATGLAIKGAAGKISIGVGILGFAGMLTFSPAVETILVYTIGGWVIAAGLRYKKAE